MNVVLIEDEAPAREKLERYIEKYDASYKVIKALSNVEDAVQWFTDKSNHFDIVFMDIQLTDGLSFEIFNHVIIQKPVVFITAFDEYALDAFKVNSIDYILKPFTFTDVSKALHKLKKMKSAFSMNPVIEKVANEAKEKKYKDRFLVRLGNHIHSIKTEEVSLFYAEGRTVYLVTITGKKFIIDYNLEALDGLLDTSQFYRVNRTYIIGINSINDVVVYSNSRLKISTGIQVEKDIIVSREKVSSFKNWLEGS